MINRNVVKVKVKDWEVCCNNMMSALIDCSLEVTEFGVTENRYAIFLPKESEIRYCPWCGKHIPEIIEVSSTEE